MKRAINMAVIVAFLLTICIVEQVLSQQYLKELDEKTNALKTIAETAITVNSVEIYDTTKDLERFWEEKESILCTFVNHKEIEDVGAEISKLLSASEEDNKEQFIESLDLITFFVSAYQHFIGINAQNIF